MLAVAGTADNNEDEPDTGGGTSGYEDGWPDKSKFSSPFAVAFDSSGALLIADANNHRIRRLLTQ